MFVFTLDDLEDGAAEARAARAAAVAAAEIVTAALIRGWLDGRRALPKRARCNSLSNHSR